MAVRVDSLTSPASTSPGSTYVTKPGDSLWSIAKKTLGDGNRWKEIQALNQGVVKDGAKLPVGAKLVLPTTTAPANTVAPPSNTAVPSQTWGPKTANAQDVAAAVKSDGFNADGSANLGRNVQVSGSASGDLGADGVKSAEALGAFKALLGGTTLNGSGKLAIKDNSLSEAQFKAAVQTLFGPHAQVSANGTFDLPRGSGPSGSLTADFKAAYGSLKLDANGSVAVKNGQVDTSLGASVQKLFGSNTLLADNQVVFKNTSFQQAKLNDELVHKFGKNASLDGTFQATVDRDGVQTATAMAAFKALIGNTTIDTTGSGLSIKNNQLSGAQFQAAVQTLFGPNAQVSTNGTFAWSKDSGVDAKLVSDFKGAYGSLTVGADGSLEVKDGKASGDVEANVQRVFGANTLLTDNKVEFKDNRFQTANLNDELVSKFGPSASLDTTFQATVDRNGLESANAMAAYKALVGNTSIDTTGSGLTITNNKLSQAQFQAAIQTVFGSGAQLSNNGTFTWTKGSGVGADLVSAFKGTYGSVAIDSNGNLALKNGKVSGQVEANIQKTFGSGALVADNKVVFQDNHFQTANLNDELTSRFGPNASLDATLQATVDNKGVQSATAMAAFKALVGGTSIDTSGSGLTLTNNKLSQAQFQAAVQSVFGPNAQLSNNGTFSWSKESGVSASLVSAFKGTYGSLSIDSNGNLALKNGKVSADVTANIQKVFGANTLVANNEVVFADNHFQKANLNDELTSKFGPNGSLDAAFQATVDHQGIQSATALAAFKALVGNTSIDTTGSGLTIKNNKLTQAQFQAAVQSVFGPNAQLSANGNFTWSKESGISADLVSSFKATYGSLQLDTDGNLAVKNGKASGDVEANLQKTFGSNTLISNNKVVFADNHFQTANLNDELVSKFGRSASLDATFQATVDNKGIESATALAAFKALVGNTTIDTSGSGLTLTNNKLTQAQFQAVVKSVFGDNAQLSNNGTFTWNKDSGVSASLVSAFKGTYGSLTVGADGNLTLKNGKVSGDATANLQKLFGSNTLISDNKVVFENDQFKSATLNDELVSKFGPSASLDSTFKATVDQNGLADATVGLAAFKQLKKIGADGGIDVKADGTVDIKDNRIDRAEVSGLLSVMAGKTVNLDTEGKLVFADGKWDPSFSSNLAAAWGNTTLNANGTVTVVDGHPELNAQIGALFGGAKVQSGANIQINGTDSARIDLKLASLGRGTHVDSTGSLVLDKGKLAGAGFTTNLVTGGNSTDGVSLNGLVTVTDQKKAAQLQGQVNAGLFKGSLGVGASSSVQLYNPGPNDPARQRIQNQGGVWAERTASYDLKGGVGANGVVMVGPVPVTLGFSADGSKTRTVDMLTVHPNPQDALRTPPVMVLHPPTTVDQVAAMRPYEQVTDSGTQSLGFGGNVSVGYGVGPAGVTAGGSMYYQVTGNLSRDIEKLDGDKVRVRFRREDGKSDVKAISASVGLKAPKLLPSEALNQKVAPIVEKVAQVGIQKSWDSMKEKDTAFDVTIDLSTEQGRSAMQHLLQNDVSEAQYWGGYKGSGVVVNSSITTDLSAQTRKTDLNLAVLNKEDMSRWLDKQQQTMSPKDFTVTEAVDKSTFDKPLLPWNPTRSVDTRFVHQTHVQTQGTLPDVGPVSTNGTLTVRIPSASEKESPTLADSKALLGLRIRVDDSKTSLNQMEKEVDPTVTLLQQMGLQPQEYQHLLEFRDALNSGMVPQKKGIIPIFGGIGDQRFGNTALDVEGFVAPRGFDNVLHTPGRQGYRTAQDYANAYLEIDKNLHGGEPQPDGEKRAAAFGATMDKITRLYAANHVPSREPNETREAYEARVAEWRQQSLFDKPDQYYNQMDDQFRNLLQADGGNLTAPLTLLKLAGPDGIFARAQLDVPQDAQKQIIEAGRANVQRFGAVDLLAGMGARLDGQGNLVLSPPPANPQLATAAAKALFGDKLQSSTSGGQLVFRGLKFPSNDFRDGLGQLLGSVNAQNGQMTVPASWDDAKTQKVLSQVFGNTAALQGRQIVFDNRSYGFIHFGDALGAAFGPNAFGDHAPGVVPPQFPTLTPIGDQGPGQNWASFGDDVMARHKGSAADWGTDFQNLGYLRGKSADLAQKPTAVAANDWVMTGS